MKYILIKLFFLALILSSCGYWINPRYVKASKKTREEFALPELKDVSDYYSNKEIIYSVNTNMLRKLMLESKSENIFIVFSAYWCAPCHKSMIELKKTLDLHKDKVEIIFISSVDWLEVNKDRLFLDKYGFSNHPLLSINIYEYGSEFMNFKKLEKFIKELAPSYTDNISLPTYLQFDNTAMLVSFYHSDIKASLIKLK